MNAKLIIIFKVFIATVFYIVGIELIGGLGLILDTLGIDYNISFRGYYFLIQGCLQLIGVLFFLYLIRDNTPLIRNIDRKWYLYGLLLGIIFVFLQTPLNWVYNFFFNTNHEIIYRFDGIPKLKSISIIPFALLIPAGEELFFRGYIQKTLQRKFNVIISIMLASMLFASIHLQFTNLMIPSGSLDWHWFYITVFLGIFSGVLFYKTKSIVPSIILHMTANLMALII